MPARQRGSVRRLPSGKWQLRYYDRDGKLRSGGAHPSKTAALDHFRDAVEPVLLGRAPDAPEMTLAEFIDVFLERHGAAAGRKRTTDDLRQRLGYATRAYGAVPLRELERMVDELAGWEAGLPERSRYGISGALRQALGAAVRWGHIDRNPAKLVGPNRQPPPREIRAFTLAEVDALDAELSEQYRGIPPFAAATGLRPEEWAALERRDIDRRGFASVRRTVSGGEVVELGKTSRSRRQVPLSRRALAALAALPPRLDTPLLWTAPGGGLLNLNNFRKREWWPAVEAAGVEKPARIYDLRSTYASNALEGGVTSFKLARVMGSSVAMIERHYGTLLDGAGADIAASLNEVEARLERRAAEG